MMIFSSVVLITALTAVYTVFYFKNMSEINEKLNFNEVLEINAGGGITIDNKKTAAFVVNRVFLNQGIYFNLIVDEKGKILVIDSALKLPLSTYETAGYNAWINNNRQPLRFENRLWRYKITPAETKIVIDDKTLGNYSGNNYQIRFLDVTESAEGLDTLRNILLLTGVVLLFVFFFMSIYFSNRVVKPIQTVWDNQQRFLEDASHELKTPLSIITANIGVLYANKEETVASQIKWLEYISNGTKRMLELIQSMLTLSKIETENTFLVKSHINIGNILNEGINSFEAAANEKNIEINRNINKNISVNTYSVLIEQIIHILIDNAVRYTPSGGIIDVTLHREKSEAVLSIQNSSPGISEEDLSKIFDRFFRLDSSRKNNGDSFGLGLSIAKSGINKIGGKIEAKSIKNQKMIFTVKIPL
jgi:two-component system sensor histidine kinase CiaH